MSLTATAARFRRLALALAVLSGCGGKVIALGDGKPSAGSGGTAGLGPITTNAGTSGGTAIGGAGAGGTTAGGAGLSSAGGAAATGPEDAGAGGAGAETCSPSGIAANEVLWIGDSWVTMPAAVGMPSTSVQRARVRDRARESHAIGIDEDYESSAAAATTMAAIARQYADRQATTPLKVIIMDGGTWDPIAAQLAGTSLDDAVDTSVADFQQFLLDVARDGTVEHIVYFMVPPLDAIPRVDDVRSRFEPACRASEVPCHFLNLGDFWAGHDDYSNGIQASTAGAVVIGDQIWEVMVKNCIAQ